MPKPFSLQPLLHLAQQKNDAALKNLGKLNKQQQSAQDKLAMLQQFRRDYQEKFQDAARGGMAPIDLRNFQDFIYRLDQAIEQQQRVIEHATDSVNSGRVELKDARRKMQSFDTLAQRHIEAEKKREAKAEQKMQDEYSGRFAAQKTAEKNDDESEPHIRSES
ncbi:MAG: flagellar export protein FliJ [Gallionellaceae bacterium]|nr:MAG: flagellar export protein FliJ [Gallionellaceae bacterium]